ncbi:tRNA pseudouridine(55) synthase TruB [Aquibacillus kalidii]|uniref:tRNA pseudouridine(55) synthase TruB n=1 Tax=Aquibacillus kalidii TaxID=2762597 RepID=UPI0016441D96|nr:tRNA pseudouridine(55) synthase TruB [Aquibacillus kalidii]
MNGILPLWKPKGFTSHDCVMKIRKLLKTKKVGHTGTLDPEVEGVLPICIGEATKVVPYLTDTTKIYIAEITLGISTETEDSYGLVVDTKPLKQEFSEDQLKKVLNQFLGQIEQIPPMYSAVKVNGKKLYEYAREGKTVERHTRTITIHHIEMLSYTPLDEKGNQTVQFQVECSKGTYIRTLCVDIGQALGYPAHMSSLVRIQTGNFKKENSYTFDQIEKAISKEEVDLLLSPIQAGVDHLDVIYVDVETENKVLNGQKLPRPKPLPDTNPFRVQYKDKLVAIYQFHPNNDQEIKPVRVFRH